MTIGQVGETPHGPLGATHTMTRSRVMRVRVTGVGHVTRRDAERVRDETSGIGPGSSGRRDGVGTGCGTSHNSSQRCSIGLRSGDCLGFC